MKKRLIIVAAVLILVFAGMLAFEKYAALRWPERTISEDEFASLEMEGMRIYGKKKKNGFLTQAFDSHLFIDSDSDIRAAELKVTYIKRARGVSERTVEVYYDTGSGFREEDCVKARLRKGTIRFTLDAAKHVRHIRVDFFNNEGCKVRLERITLNPARHYHTSVIRIFGVLSLILLLIFSVKGTGGQFASSLVGWAVIFLSVSFPYMNSLHNQRMVPYLLLGFLAIFLLCTLFLKEGKRKDTLFILTLCALAFCLYYYWAKYTPYAEGPDEAMHHDVVYYICRYGVIPRGDDPAIRNEIWGFSYAFSPILPFIIGGYLERAFRGFLTSWHSLIMMARMVSIVSGTLTVYFTFRLSRLLFRERPVRYLLPVFVAFWPELAFINTYVNSDAMAIMSTAMIMYFWASGCEYDWRTRDAVGLAVSMGICALTYYNCYGFILVSIPVFFISIARGSKSGKEIARTTSLVVILTLAICGWWFVRNLIIYNGDLLGQRTLNANQEMYARDGYKPSQSSNPLEDGYSIIAMISQMEWLTKTLRSFVAMFSYYVLQARSSIYELARTFLGIGLAGDAIALAEYFRERRKGKKRQTHALFWIAAALSAAIVFALALYYSYAVDFQPQGRYILPCIVPLGCIIMRGYDELMACAAALFRKWKPAFAGALPAFLTVILCAACFSLTANIFLDTVCLYYLG